MKISIEDFSEDALFRVLDRVGFAGQQGGRSASEVQWVQNPSDQIPPALLAELIQLRTQLEQAATQKQLPSQSESFVQPSQWVAPAPAEPTIDRQQFTEALARYQTRPTSEPDRSPSIPVAATVIEDAPGIEVRGWLRWGPIALLLGVGLFSIGVYQALLRSPPDPASSQLQIKPPPQQAKPVKSSDLLPVPYPPPPPGGAPLRLPTVVPRK